tara:strand:- start:926 stop:1393 length:468 start_codon:yes stop_codon:yes gene_type:complete
MIISCPNCKKKFEVADNLIPENGRLLQCSGCSNKWFFKNETSTVKPKTKKEYDINKKTEHLFKNEIPNEVERIIIDAEKSEENIDNLRKVSVKKIDKISFFNLILVILISFSAVIILLDTFKNPIENILPGFNFMLDNFYETLKDFFLFFKDLTR